MVTEIKDIAPILSGALGAIATMIAVIVTGFINFKVVKLNLDKQREQRIEELKLEKLEELFLLFDKWQINVVSIYLFYLHCYAGKLQYSQVLENVNKNSALAPGDAQKYKMLIDIHFPSLQESYSPVESARKSLAPFLSDPGDNKLTFDDFTDAQELFDVACREFKSCICSQVQKIRGAH